MDTSGSCSLPTWNPRRSHWSARDGMSRPKLPVAEQHLIIIERYGCMQFSYDHKASLFAQMWTRLNTEVAERLMKGGC